MLFACVRVRVAFFGAQRRRPGLATGRFPAASFKYHLPFPRAFSALGHPPPSAAPPVVAEPLLNRARAKAHDAKHALVSRLRPSRPTADWTAEQVYLTGDA